MKRSAAGKVGRTLLWVALASTSLHVAQTQAQAVDPVVFSFATVGDSRQDPTSPDPTTLLPNNTGALLAQDKLWLQNTKAWTRILRTIQSQKANAFFVNGDMIMGYGRATVPSAWTTTPPSVNDVLVSDLMKFQIQYAYWRGIVANLFETGTYVLPISGNHETQCNSAVSTNTGASACVSGKTAYVENENAWRYNMRDLVDDLNANLRFQSVVGAPAQNVTGLTAATAPGAADGLTTDQSYLSYSFDINTAIGLLHFAVVNTDPVGADSHAPIQWLANDLATAKTRGAVKYFVFGHKPAFTYNYKAAANGTIAAAGLDVDANSPAGSNAFWGVIAQYNATYFCGHEHIVHIDQHPDPTGNTANTPYHVLVGSGGSPFDDKLAGTCPACSEPVFTSPSDRYYAWALVRVHQSGKVTLDAYGFSDIFGPTQALQSISNLQ